MQSHSRSKQQQTKKKPVWRKVGKRITGLFEYVPSGTLYAYISRRGRLYRESLQTKDVALAKRKLAEFKRRLDRTEPRWGRVTLVAWLEQNYFPTLRGSPDALKAKQRIIERVKQKWLAARTQPLRDIRESELLRFLNEEYGKWSPSYWNQALTLVRDALAMAVRDHVIMESPAAGLKYRRRAKPVRLTPTWQEFQQIVADIRAQRFNGHDAEQSGDFIEFLGLAGLGQGEAAAITRADVDLDSDRIIIFRRKTSQGFTIPVYPQLRPLIEKLCEGKKPNERLFEIDQARAALANACKRLGLPAVTQRSLRRMFITRCIEKGIDVKVIADWQGHKDGGKLILDTYSHVRPEHAQRMAALLTTEQPANVVPMQQADAS